MRILAESQNFVLRHEYEDVSLFDKRTQEKRSLGEHYGDPKAGLISPEQDWFITFGEGLLYFDFERGLKSFFRSGFVDSWGKDSSAFVHAIRYEPSLGVKVLLDPWSDYASTWLLNLETLEIAKLSDSPSLVEQPFQEEVEF